MFLIRQKHGGEVLLQFTPCYTFQLSMLETCVRVSARHMFAVWDEY